MGILSIIWGILALLGLIVAFTPCLGWLNWINIPFALIGIIFAAVAIGNPQTRNQGIAGLILGIIVVLVGIIRLIIGAGLL